MYNIERYNNRQTGGNNPAESQYQELLMNVAQLLQQFPRQAPQSAPPQRYTVLDAPVRTQSQDEMGQLWRLITTTFADYGFSIRKDHLSITEEHLIFAFAADEHINNENVGHVQRLQQIANTLTRTIGKRIELQAHNRGPVVFVRSG